MLHLSPYIGTGTSKQDALRPLGTPLDAPGVSCVSLRPVGSRDGFGLVWIPEGIKVPRGAMAIAADPDERLMPGVVQRAGNRLGLSLGARRASHFSQALFFGERRSWRRVRPDLRGIRELWIGGRCWFSDRVKKPRCLWWDPSDAFNRADENPIASPWVTGVGGTTNMRLISNAMGVADDSHHHAYYGSAASTGNHYSRGTITVLGSTSDQGPCVRHAAGSESMYIVSFDTAQPQFFYFSSGSYNFIGNITATAATNDEIRLAWNGSTGKCWRNGSEVTGSPVTDATLSGGQPGWSMFQDTQRMDTWDGADGDGSPAGSPPMFRGS